MTFLDEIINLKRLRLLAEKARTDFERLKTDAAQRRSDAEPHRLTACLRQNKINIIAEIKRSSPSKGVINDKIDVAEIAKYYKLGGACAISVLTEEDKFGGSLADLTAARKAVEIPILRKDFIFDEFQIYEAAAAGADAVLLIAAMLDDEVLLRLYRLAEQQLGLDVLLEIHTLEELERAKKIAAKIIGINNRDLHSFNVSLDVSRELIQHATKDALTIAESGLKTPEDLTELRKLGFSGFLIGETLMRSANPAQSLKNLL